MSIDSKVFLNRVAKPNIAHGTVVTLYAMTVPSRTNISAYVRLFIIGIGKPLTPELFEITKQVNEVTGIPLKEHTDRQWLYVKGIGVAAQAAHTIAKALAVNLGIEPEAAHDAYHVYAL